MNEKAVLYSLEDGIATITLNRPSSLNSINDVLVSELTECLYKTKQDPNVHNAIITGNGKAFCAGGDLSFLESLTDIVKAQEFIAQVGGIVTLIMEMEKPIIAMVNGVAAGAGFNLALACDIVYCAKSARFAQSFAKVGLVPDCGGMYLLPRLVGLHKAKELMFTADLIDSTTADKLGLINKVVEEHKLQEETYLFAQRLAQAAPLAIGFMKKMLNVYDTLNLSNLLALEAQTQAVCMQTLDHKEGISAFKQKRLPVFKGI